jgi:hypothetical protein
VLVRTGFKVLVGGASKADSELSAVIIGEAKGYGTLYAK